jgi:hypothetical protein
VLPSARNGANRPSANLPTETISIARLLDEARALIVDARDRQQRPTHLLVHPSVHQVVQAAKQRETVGGRPLLLLGLVVTPSDAVTVDRPVVR